MHPNVMKDVVILINFIDLQNIPIIVMSNCWRIIIPFVIIYFRRLFDLKVRFDTFEINTVTLKNKPGFSKKMENGHFMLY